jgi:hypothetical protein
VLGQQLVRRQHLEAENLLRSELTRIHWLEHRKSRSEAKAQGLDEVVVTEVDVEAVAELLQTLTKLTLAPSLEL